MSSKSFLGYNIFLSPSESGDKYSKKNKYVFLGHARLLDGTEVKVYRMWMMKDRRRELKKEGKK